MMYRWFIILSLLCGCAIKPNSNELIMVECSSGTLVFKASAKTIDYNSLGLLLTDVTLYQVLEGGTMIPTKYKKDKLMVNMPCIWYTNEDKNEN